MSQFFWFRLAVFCPQRASFIFTDSSDSISLTWQALMVCVKLFSLFSERQQFKNRSFDRTMSLLETSTLVSFTRVPNNVQDVASVWMQTEAFYFLFFAHEQCHCCIANWPATHFEATFCSTSVTTPSLQLNQPTAFCCTTPAGVFWVEINVRQENMLLVCVCVFVMTFRCASRPSREANGWITAAFFFSFSFLNVRGGGRSLLVLRKCSKRDEKWIDRDKEGINGA